MFQKLFQVNKYLPWQKIIIAWLQNNNLVERGWSLIINSHFYNSDVCLKFYKLSEQRLTQKFASKWIKLTQLLETAKDL